jgi:hypothetical protein
MYSVVARKQGASWEKISGHTAERYLKEYIAAERMDLSDQTGDEAGDRHV